MSGTQTEAAGAAAEAVTTDGASLFDQVIAATKQTEPDRAASKVTCLVPCSKLASPV